MMIKLVRSPDILSIDTIEWSQTLEFTRAFAWKPSSTLSRLLAKGKIGAEIEVGSEDAKALADVLKRAFRPQRRSHRQRVRWGAIGFMQWIGPASLMALNNAKSFRSVKAGVLS
jgi:hypothetical protein